MTIWNDAPGGNVDRLKQLWADGLSASQIAFELGGMTRNAIIGKVHRLGLAGRAKIPSAARPRPRLHKVRAAGTTRAAHIVSRGNAALAYDYAVEPEAELIEIPVEQRKTLLQLTGKTCRWPVGDPGRGDFYFCGGDTVGEAPYCAYHSRVAYQPLADRRRESRPFHR